MIILFQIRRGSFQTDAAIGVPVVDDSPQRRSAFATGVGRMEQIDIANTKFAGFIVISGSLDFYGGKGDNHKTNLQAV